MRDLRTIIKICGITNLEDALLSVKLGADQLGFNFYNNSPRYVTPGHARSFITKIPENILKVGVFVNETLETICEIAGFVGLQAIQLHGDEDNRFIEKVHTMSGLPVIKALHVSPDFSPDDAKHSSADAVLLDKYSPRELGGTGETFDWEIAQSLRPFVQPMYLAGGLTPENVAEAINKVRPYAVDACSKLESAPGKKDANKLRCFIAAVKGTI